MYTHVIYSRILQVMIKIYIYDVQIELHTYTSNYIWTCDVLNPQYNNIKYSIYYDQLLILIVITIYFNLILLLKYT